MSRSGHWVDEVCSHWATKLLRWLDMQAGFKLIVGDAVFGGLSRDWAKAQDDSVSVFNSGTGTAVSPLGQQVVII